MKIKLAIFFYLFILLEASKISNIKCKCEQLLSKSDCQNQQQYCFWEQDKCITNSDSPDVVQQNITYCSTFPDTICQNTLGCAWVNKECQQFAGCTAYYYSKSTQCQQVSQNCFSDGTHCIEIGNCSDYKTEVACFKNQKNLLCFWNEGKCQDFTNCNQLPTTFKSDSECREQLLFCTVAEQGGCLESAENCDGHKLESQCHWNKSKQQSCVWQDNKCVHRQCSIAPLTLTTDIQCNAFMVNCTTKENGGCTERTFCQKTTFEAACVINQFREPCIWIDNVCYDQICSKAPNSFTTNEKCKMIKKNCITTQNGCIEQLSCLSANNQIGCIDMEDGTKCFWNGLKCLQKTCSNNTTATSQAECETFSSECTFNVSASIGCVDKICENIVQQDQCTQDSFENKCAWKGNCFIKSCVFAPKSLQSHNECENYLIGCTLDSTGYGCTDKVLSCQRYTSQNSCYKTLSGEFCFWKNSQCVDRLCNMADSSITTAAGCQQFKSTCILNNNQIGCMYLTPNCNERLLHENCEYGSQPICIWNNDKCVEQSCDTANIVGSPNYLIVFTQSNCNQYMTNCVLNNSSNGCIAKPKTCSELGINNCFVSIQNDCIWTGAQCKEKICSNLIGSNHYHCYNQFSKCTVNSDLNGCIDIKKCYQYTLFEQCKINQIGDQCIWTGTQCRDSKCNDSTDTSDFDANEKCNQLNSQCTVLGKVNQQGCVIKQNICLEYKYEYQCQSTINQVQCIWMQDQCLELQTIKCENIKLILYNDNNCSSVQFRCKVNNLSSGCIDKICTDYPYSTKDACENIKGCTINRDENNCIEKKDLCSDYSSDLSQCKYSKEGKCVIKGNLCIYSLVNCTSLPTPIIYTDCSDKRDFCVMSIQGTTKSCVPGLCTSFVGSTFSFEICQQYDQSCTVNTSGTGCIQMANTCATATSVNCNYSKNDHNCIWNNSVCKPIATASENNCELITDYSGNLTFQKCQELSNNYCSVNRQKNACVKLEADCYEYADLNNCFQSSQGRCIQHIQEELITPCTEMQNSIECKNIYLGESFTYTHQICEQLKSTCTNDSTIGCKDKTCSNVDTLKTNHEECELWLSTCTINSTHDACVSKTLTCQEQTVLSCLWSQEGQCIALNNQCVKISCHLLPNSFTTHTQCENAFNKCTIANIGGCTTKSQNCKNYLTQIQCKFNFNNQKCWWNQTTMNCVNLKCEEIEKTNNYSSHNQCYNASDSIKCTVAATGLGCQQLKQCDSYTTQPSCVIDNSNQICVWNTNTLKCQYKQCNVAPLSLNSHDQCQNFYSICTVLVKLNNQQQEIVQGCQSLSSRCNDYKFEQQCYITKANQKCAWFESACTNLSCNTAPKTPNYSTHENCQNYLQTCTVSSDLLGCIPIPSKCTEISIEISCIKDASGNYCFWQDSSCQIKTCSNAPPDINTAQLCSLWLPTCTAENTNKCKRLSCEEYEFKTDSECNAAMSKCTTDGRKCVTRGSCQTLSEAGCIKSNKDEQCYWLGTKCINTTDHIIIL